MATEADIIKEYLVSLGFDVDESEFAVFRSQLAGLMVAAATIGTAVLGLAGTVTSYVTKAAEGLDELHDFAELVDMDANALASLEYVAENADSSVGAVRSSLKGVNDALGGVALKLPRAVNLFKRLHLEAYNGNGQLKTAEELLDDVSRRIRDMPRAQQTRFLSALGIDPTMLKTLTGNWAALRIEFAAVNRALGYDVRNAALAADEYTSALKRLWGIVNQIYVGIAAKLMPRLTRSFDQTRKRIVENIDKIVAVAEPLLNMILDAADDVVALGMRGVQALEEVLQWLQNLDDATGGWAKTIAVMVLLWKAWNSQMMQSEFGKMLRLATVLALLYDDYKAWTEGKKSLIDWGGWMGTILRYMIKIWAYWQLFKIGIGVFLSIAAAVLSFVFSLGLLIASFYLTNWLFSKLLVLTQGFVWLSRAVKFLWVLTLADDLLIVIAVLGVLAYVIYDLYQNWDNVMEGYRRGFVWLGQQFGKMGDTIAEWGKSTAQSVMDAWEGLKTWFTGWFDWFGQKAVAVADFFTPDFARLAPASATAAAGGGGVSQQISMRQEFHIDGSGSPEATGRAVLGVQKNAAADAARNFRPPAR